MVLSQGLIGKPVCEAVRQIEYTDTAFVPKYFHTLLPVEETLSQLRQRKTNASSIRHSECGNLFLVIEAKRHIITVAPSETNGPGC